MNQPKIFVGSSSEGVQVARAIEDNLCGDALVTVWDQNVFRPGHYLLESICAQLDATDFGIFVLTPDDAANIRKKPYLIGRDNIFIELGLFISRVGRERSFVVKPNSAGNFHLPTYLEGLNHLTYDPTPDNLKAALAPACSQIWQAVQESIGQAPGPAPKPISESEALQRLRPSGLLKVYDKIESMEKNGVQVVYTTRVDAISDVLRDLRQSVLSCRVYAAVYFMELFERHSTFTKTLAEAAKRAAGKGHPYMLQFTSLNSRAPNGSPDDAVLQIWSKRERDLRFTDLLQRIERAHTSFLEAARDAARGQNASLEVEARLFREYLSPHCMLIIDEQIVYLGLYDWAHCRGSEAPTLRLQGGEWTDVFLAEAEKIDRVHSVPYRKYVLPADLTQLEQCLRQDAVTS